MKTIILSLLLINSLFAINNQPTLWDTEERGPFQVGYLPDNIFYDKERTGFLKQYKNEGTQYCDNENGRLISYSIYYPVDKQETKGKSKPKALPEFMAPFFSGMGFDVTTYNFYKGVYLNTKLSQKSQNYPIVFFTNGLGGIHHQYSSIIEYVASNGYIVVAMDHEFSSMIYNPETKCFSPEIDIFDGKHKIQDFIGEAHEQEAEDFHFFLRNYDRTHPILKKADFSKLTIFGHSLGGMTSFNFCSQNPYVCKGAVDLDGFDTVIRGAWPWSDKIKTLKLTARLGLDYGDFELKKVVHEDKVTQNNYYGLCDNVDHSSYTDSYYIMPNPNVEKPSIFLPKVSQTVVNFIGFAIGKRATYQDDQDGIHFMDSQQMKDYVRKQDHPEFLQKL